VQFNKRVTTGYIHYFSISMLAPYIVNESEAKY